jgi:DNA modification methylase
MITNCSHCSNKIEYQEKDIISHRIMCGDSTKIEDVEKLMDGKKADMVFTDPPYGMNFDIKNDDDNFKQVFVDAIANMYAFSKKENWYICGNFRCLSFFHLEVEKLGLELYEKIVWVKNLYGQGKFYNRMHEDILFCGSGSFYKIDKDVDVWNEDSVRNFMGSKNANEAVGHPTQKPVNLVKRAIKNSSKNEDIVMDLFLGSGSTLIACEKTNRICYGMELDPKYIDVIIKRYEDYTGNKAIKL